MTVMKGDLNRLSLEALFTALLPNRILRREASRFLDEDLGRGDVTSVLTIPATQRGRARIVAREACVLAGLDAAAYIATSGRRDLLVVERKRDGSPLRAGTVVAEIEGRLRDVLAVERTVLNLLGRLSGIATLTAQFVAQLRTAGAAARRTPSRAGRGARAVLLDTRKTTPGLRLLEKYAVRCGGGHLHRLGLWDAILVKDNHLAALAGEPGGALAALRRRLERGGAMARRTSLSFVEIEVDRLEQFAEILRWPKGLVDIVLLDNMSAATLRRAVNMRDRARSAIRLEASGGVSLRTIARIAGSGVDRISAGAITHSARSIDFSLEIDAITEARS